MLHIHELEVRYGVVPAVKNVSLQVPDSQIVTILGANGSGKSTLMRTISGLIKPASGTITWQDVTISGMAPHNIVKRGIAHVPEGRWVFANLSVRENLEMGAYLRRDKAQIRADLDFVLTAFPRLKERFRQSGGTLSGGEQQMLAIGRALMTKPQLLILDEPSLGIAPLVVKSIFETIRQINQELKLTILLVEQNANMAMKIANYAYVLQTGEVQLEGPANEIAQNDAVKKAYLGK